jgi:integrase
MKGGREHKVPLSSVAVALLKSLPTEDGNKFVFIGGTQPRLSHTALSLTLRRLGRSETVHGFHSSFADWCHERTAFSNIVIEMSLAHSVGSAVEKSYRRTDLFAKRRQLMNAWATFLAAPAQRAGRVVALRGARS